MGKIQSYINYIADSRARRSIRSLFSVFLNDDDPTTFKACTFSGAVTFEAAVEVAGEVTFAGGISIGACTTHQINITDVWGVGITGAAVAVGDYSNAIAFGEVTEHVVGLCVNLSASTDDASNIIPIHGKFTTTADCGTNAGAQAVYGRIDIKHDLASSYAVRGAIDLAGTPAVHQAYALFGTVDMTACTISGAGGYIAGLAIEINGSTDVTGDGKVCGSRISWVQTNAMTVETVGSMIAINSGGTGGILDSGFRIDTGGTLTDAFYSYNTSGTVTNGLRLNGAHTNLLSLPAEGTAPVEDTTNTGFGNDPVKISILVGGAQYYLVAAKTLT